MAHRAVHMVVHRVAHRAVHMVVYRVIHKVVHTTQGGTHHELIARFDRRVQINELSFACLKFTGQVTDQKLKNLVSKINKLLTLNF